MKKNLLANPMPLTLSKEKVRDLDPQDLRHVVGGLLGPCVRSARLTLIGGE
jgi:hypothetical protein